VNITLLIYLINVKPIYISLGSRVILLWRHSMIERILKDLGRINGVNGSLVVGKDGLIIESEVPSDIDSELVAAMASAVFGTAERSAEEMKHEPLQQVMIEGDKGKTLMIDAGEGILVVIADININLGLIRIEMRRSAERVVDTLT
jgi:uncharacterized protein